MDKEDVGEMPRYRQRHRATMCCYSAVTKNEILTFARRSSSWRVLCGVRLAGETGTV